jgi:hypothetical protein
MKIALAQLASALNIGLKLYLHYLGISQNFGPFTRIICEAIKP